MRGSYSTNGGDENASLLVKLNEGDHGIVISSSVNGGRFLHQLRDYQLLKNASAPQSLI
jgi:hypothetical protein